MLASIWNQPETISHATNYRNGTVHSFFMISSCSWCSSLTYVLWHLHEHQRTLLLNGPTPAVPPRANHSRDLLPGDCKGILSTKVSTSLLPHNKSSQKNALCHPSVGKTDVWKFIICCVHRKMNLYFKLLRRRGCVSIHLRGCVSIYFSFPFFFFQFVV